MSNGVSVVDLFCGAGGLSHGFKLAGMPPAAGIDIDEACRFPYESNNSAPFIRKDLNEVTAAALKRLFSPGSVRVLVGCAPCQPFSVYNQKNRNPDWQLLHRFGDLIRQVRPEVVSMENVPRVQNFQGGKVFHQFINTLRAAGYQLRYDTLHAADFGLSQTRRRLVLLASRMGEIQLPVPNHLQPYRTVRDEIEDFPRLSHGDTDGDDPLHRAAGLSTMNVRRIAASRPGGTWRDWPTALVPDCHRAATGRGYSSVYGRMQWDFPAPTITTQFYGFGNGRFGHPEQNRALSLREGAVLQGFSRDYQFVPPNRPAHFSTVGRLIGNAVPVVMAQAIAGAITAHIRALT